MRLPLTRCAGMARGCLRHRDTKCQQRVKGANRLVLVRSKEDAVSIHAAEFYGDGRRSFKTVTNAGQNDGTEVYYYDCWQIIVIYDGSANWVK